MKCPHCLADLKYRERTDRRCPRCQKSFALEPRANPLKMSDLRLRRLAERLSQQGAYRYTASQLGYFTVLRDLQPLVKQLGSSDPSSQRRNALISVLVYIAALLAILAVFWVVALLAPNLASVLRCLTIPLVLIVIILTVGTLTSYPRLRRKIEGLSATAFDQANSFEQTYVLPWERVHGQLPGRASQEELARLRQYQPPPSRLRAALVSPDMDVLDCLRANGVPERLDLALLPFGELYSEAEKGVLALLREQPRLPILLLHDASLQGALLRDLLLKRWKLAPNHRIVELGLRSAQVRRWHWPWRQEPVAPLSLKLLESRARTPGALALEQEEIKWLSQGYVTPVRFVPPAKLVQVTTKAVERLAPARPPRVDPERQAQLEAQAIGFMSWPQR